MNDDWDAIVVGGGPAGSAIAIRLALWGFRILLSDRSQFPRDKLCGEFLSTECWPMLASLGVGPAVRGSGYQPIRRLRIELPGMRYAKATLPQRAGRGAIALSRHRLDHILVQRAREVGVTVVENHEVTDLCMQDDRVTGVRIRHIENRDRASDQPMFRAKLVIAADGRQSTVVAKSGRVLHAARSTPYDVCAVKRHYQTNAPLQTNDTITLHSFDGGYAGICCVESEIVNLCTLVPVPAIRRARGHIDEALRTLLRGSGAEQLLDSATPVGDWKSVPNVQVQWSQASRAGVLYVGDAMGTVDPLGGEGMEMALEGALLASRYARQALVSAGGCDRSLQASYYAAWHSRFARRIQLCRAFSWWLARPRMLGPFLASATQPVWTHALLPFAFRATRGQPDLIESRQLRRSVRARMPAQRTAEQRSVAAAGPG